MAITSDFACCAGCGVRAVGSVGNPDRPHHHALGGTAPVSQAAIVPEGSSNAWHFNTVNSISYFERSISGTQRAGRFSIYFDGLPSGGFTIIELWSPLGTFVRVRYSSSTQSIVATVGDFWSSETPVVAGRFYEVCWAGDVGSGTRTMKITVNGVDKGTASLVTPASTYTRLRWGVCSSTTVSMYMGNIVFGTVNAEYPYDMETGSYKPVCVTARQLTSDGAHSFSTNTDFKFNNLENVPTSVTDAYTRLVGLMDAMTSFIAITGATAGEYLEFLHTGMVAATKIYGVEFVTSHMSAGTDANKLSLRVVSGASNFDLLSDADFSYTSIGWHSFHRLLDPTGVAHTTALINAWKFRLTSSWTAADVTPPPYIGGLTLEVAYIPTVVAPPQEGTSTEQNPVHIFPGPGTYPVTYEVEDNDGNVASITKNVVVPA
jgi:hypothetical protein